MEDKKGVFSFPYGMKKIISLVKRRRGFGIIVLTELSLAQSLRASSLDSLILKATLLLHPTGVIHLTKPEAKLPTCRDTPSNI